jgi:NAD(P)H-dependent flavin oxidoreductase YrpB (nitropropane dioxygenase family)
MAMKKTMDLSWSQMVMAANSAMLTKATLVDGRLDSGVMPTGQVVGVIDDLPTCQELVDRIVAEAAKVLEDLAGSAS